MQSYQDLYATNSEPWDYSRRAAEILRHETISRAVQDIGPPPLRALDVGSSLGQLSHRIRRHVASLIACDVSFEAVRKARGMERNQGIQFVAAGLPGLPFQEGFFNLIVVADGINEFVPKDRQDEALIEISKSLAKDGTALFSDYLRPGQFDPLVRAVEKRFRIAKVIYLNDRLWYQFESWFKALRRWSWVRSLLSQVWIARLLQIPAKAFGPRGSTHILIVAQKT